MKSFLPVIIVTVLLSSCTSAPRISPPHLGQDINIDTGLITKRGLAFRFKKPDQDWTVEKYFHHIYFEGDTVCFSFPLGAYLPHSFYKVWFEYGEHIMTAERTGDSRKNIWGFSLVGSLLEKSYPQLLASPASELSLPLITTLTLHMEYGSQDFLTNLQIPVTFTIKTFESEM